MSKGKLYLGKINLSKIVKDRLFKGEKGMYCDITIWVNDDEPDQFGNHLKIQQSTKKEEDKIYLGECKRYESQQQPTSTVGATSNDLEEDDLPF